MKLTFHGHACLELESGTRLLLDPFISGNPLAGIRPEELAPDYILLSHAHGDHLGDTVPIARRTGATVIAVNELANWLQDQGVNAHPMNFGGEITFADGLRVKLTQAWHTSSLPDGTDCGLPCGFLFWLAGKCVYYAGDTGLFGDMRTVIAPHGIDLAILPIGGNWTMGPQDAVLAAEWLAPKQVLPIHYNTFPLIAQDAEEFKRQVESRTAAQCVIVRPGETLEL